MQISQHVAARPYVGVLAKTASFISPENAKSLQHIGTNILEHGPWLMSAAGIAAGAAASIADRMTAASRKANAYKAMIDANPHLSDPHLDSTLVQKYFNVLYAMNPEFAKEPTVAASFVMNHTFGANLTQPHAAIFGDALKLKGDRGGQGQKPMGSMASEIAKTISLANESVGREKRIKDFVTDFRKEKADMEKDFTARGRMYSMGKKREQSANAKLDQAHASLQRNSGDAARFQSLLDQHGISYR